MRLAEHYSQRPVAELPLLFQRILSNRILDWFRRQKTRATALVTMSDLDATRRAEVLHAIEEQIQALPPRQREAFLLRYWEELDVTETASVMGCSEGSVKTHCSRATRALAKALRARGIAP